MKSISESVIKTKEELSQILDVSFENNNFITSQHNLWESRLKDSIALRGKANAEMRSMLDVLIKQAKEHTVKYHNEMVRLQSVIDKLSPMVKSLEEARISLWQAERKKKLRVDILSIAENPHQDDTLELSTGFEVDQRKILEVIETAKAFIELQSI